MHTGAVQIGLHTHFVRQRSVFVTGAESFGYFIWILKSKIIENKKVLLRERKRHTARRVASTRYAALSGGYLGYSPPSSRPGRGYLIQTWSGGTTGTPHHPDLVRGVPPHHPDLGWGTPNLRWGNPPDLRYSTPHLDLKHKTIVLIRTLQVSSLKHLLLMGHQLILLKIHTT